MDFFLRPSYYPSYRIFANQNRLVSPVYEFLKKSCLWGSYDRDELHDDTRFLGFEFRSGLEASEALVECFKLKAKYDEENKG